VSVHPLRQFLDTLFSDCTGVVEVRALPAKARAWARPGQWAPLAPFLSAQIAARQNLFAGIATRVDSSKGTAGNLLEVPAVWIDFDRPRAALDAHLQAFPFRPSLIVGSGAGTHVHWKLREPHAVREPEALARVASVLRRLATHFDADRAATDVPRVLRLPQTFNFKYDTPRPVTLDLVTDAAVNLSELEDFLPADAASRGHLPTDGTIEKGSRNDTLHIIGRALHRKGASLAEMYHALERVNATRCSPPVDVAELKQIVQSAYYQRDSPDFTPPIVIHDATPPPPPPEDDAIERERRQQRIRREARRLLDREDRGDVPDPVFLTLQERLARPRTDRTWRITGWQPARSRVMAAAQFKAGKTTLIANVLLSLADGTPFLGSVPVVPVAGRVVLLDTEMSESQLDDWHRAVGIRRTDAIITESLFGRVLTFDLLDTRQRARWAAWLRERQTEYLILDCLRPVFDVLGLDENRDAGRFLTAFDALLREAAIPDALIAHHMGHVGERARGDSRLRDWPDVEWRLVRRDDDPSSARFLSAHGRDVDQPERRLAMDLVTRRLTIAGGSRREERAALVVPDVLAALAESPSGLLSGRAVKDALKEHEHSRRDVEAALTLAARDGLLLATAGPRNARLYAVSAPSVPVSRPIYTAENWDTQKPFASVPPPGNGQPPESAETLKKTSEPVYHPLYRGGHSGHSPGEEEEDE
jgi:AAA domain/Primase C terminal 1 (PriCT-1)/RepB DNA-primase from phage plasmid